MSKCLINAKMEISRPLVQKTEKWLPVLTDISPFFSSLIPTRPTHTMKNHKLKLLVECL